MSVQSLLQQSKDAHQRYREAVPRRIPQGDTTIAVAGDQTAAYAALVDACRFRTEAQALDPNGLDPAWADEPEHEALMQFYVSQLTR